MAKKRKWTMRDGTTILIKDMSDSHILNSIKLFEKFGTRKQEVEWLKQERNKRLGIVDKKDEPIENRWSILDLRKVDKDGL